MALLVSSRFLPILGAASRPVSSLGSLGLSGTASRPVSFSGPASEPISSLGSLGLSGPASEPVSSLGSLGLSGPASRPVSSLGSLGLSGTASRPVSSLDLSGPASRPVSSLGSLGLSGARHIFNEMPPRDRSTVRGSLHSPFFRRFSTHHRTPRFRPDHPALATFDAILEGGKMKAAVQLLVERGELVLDCDRYARLFKACKDSPTPTNSEIEVIHNNIKGSTGHGDIQWDSQIIQMYSTSGFISHAYKLFCAMPTKDINTWINMINGLTDNGFASEALHIFSRFHKEEIISDAEIYVSVFAACEKVGGVKEGLFYFKMMRERGIIPTVTHHCSLVRLLGSAGHLDKALEIVEASVPYLELKSCIDLWVTLMNLCLLNGNIQLWDRCFRAIKESESDASRPKTKWGLGLLPVNQTDLEADEKFYDNAKLLFKNKRRQFHAGKEWTIESQHIFEVSESMTSQLKGRGYFPDVRNAERDVEDESREEALLCHSERLALADIVSNTPARTPVLMLKTLRTCPDCHMLLKLASSFSGRAIWSSDRRRFHHFEDGSCSCEDIW